jgi:tRNA(Ile)-lysidine synthase
MSVFEEVRATGMLEQGDAVVVMVSGGCDSVCLLDVARELCGAQQLLALHVNYALRGEESEQDERFVRELCAGMGIELEVARAPAPPAEAGNLQAWARDLRYSAATRLALARDARVASGHTSSDQVETVLYRLAASPGRRALLGMPARDGRLIRPLLGLTREQTRTHCLERGLRWREDSSNASDRYTRARVRKRVVPALRELHPAAEANLLRTTELLRDEAAVLEEVVSTALSGRRRIALARLAQLPPALARLVVIRLAEDAAGKLIPGIGDRVGELLVLAPEGGSAELHIGGGVRALVEYGVLRFAPLGAGAEPPEPVTLPVPGEVRFGAWRLACRIEPDPGFAASGALFDADALGALLTVRGWRAGDRVAPAGLRGTKTLADLFGEHRVPKAERLTVPVVVAGEQIAWVPGLAAGEPFGVTTATRRTALLSAVRE